MSAIDPNDVWECDSCEHANVGGDRCDNCHTAKPWTRAAMEDEIEGAHPDSDMTVERAILALCEMDESEFARRSPTLAYLIAGFGLVLRHVKLLADFQASSYQLLDVMPDLAATVFEGMDEAFAHLSSNLAESVTEAQGPDDLGRTYNKLHAAYVLQMFEELTRNGPEPEPEG